MKKTQKIVGLVLAGVLLVSASVMGTFAYLTAQDQVKNTFTVGDVAINMDEAAVDENGAMKPGDRTKANHYLLIPGKHYDKDPIIEVQPHSQKCWLFVRLENGIKDIEAPSNYRADHFIYSKITDQLKTNGWVALENNPGIYAYEKPVSAGDKVRVFTNFMIDPKATHEQLAKIDNRAVTVTAYAVQEYGFDNAVDAWKNTKYVK